MSPSVAIDWQSLGPQLLDREHRPLLLVDDTGRVVATNQALRYFLEAVPPTGAQFVGDWVDPADQASAAEVLDRARRGERAHVRLQLKPSLMTVQPVFDVSALTETGLVAWLMVEAHSLPVGAPPVPALGVHYDVTLEHGTLGSVRWLAREGRSLPVQPGVPCWKQVVGRDSPCEHCPALGTLAGASSATATRCVSTTPFVAEVGRARRVGPELITVSWLPLSEADYSAVLRLRVEALAEQHLLTPRERQVLRMLLLGRNVDDVAALEGISPRTVKYHQQNLLRKLGAESRHDLFRLLA
jgi:DNA-binding CsgD family transcriptional regulator